MAEPGRTRRHPFAGRGPLLQPALRVIAEASWITVVYAALAVMVSKHAPILGPVEFIGFALLGVLVARIGRSRDEMGPLLLIFAVLASGLLGWLASPEARALLPNPNLALGVHLAGWFAGVAVVRGALIGTGEQAAQDIEKLLRNVPPVLAAIWAYTSVAVRPDLLLPFAVSALWGTVGFLSAAVISIGMARLDVLHKGLQDKGQRRGWKWLVTAVGLTIVPVAIPIGILSGIPLSQMLRPIGGPLQLLLSLVAIPLAFIVEVLSWILRPAAENLADLLDQIAAGLEARQRPEEIERTEFGTILGLILWTLTVFIVLLALFMVARWLLARKSLYGEDLDEVASDTERDIVIPDTPVRPAGGNRFQRRGSPHDVVTAYLGALRELEKNDDLARRPNETPARHAARLRSTGVPAATDFARLAASYQLARYGERRITSTENVRAVGRFQRLRKLLRAPA